MKKILSGLFLLTMSLTLFATTEKITRIIGLGSLKYQDIEDSCNTILKDSGEILYFAGNNAVLVESTEVNVRRVELLIKYAGEELRKKNAAVISAPPEKTPGYKVIPLGNVDFGSVDSNCRAWLSPNGKMSYSMANNVVIVTDTPAVIGAIEKFIAELNKAIPGIIYDGIQYSRSARGDGNTVIIYSTDWFYPRWRRLCPPYHPPPPPRPRPPRPRPPQPDSKDGPRRESRPGVVRQRPDVIAPGRQARTDGGSGR